MKKKLAAIIFVILFLTAIGGFVSWYLTLEPSEFWKFFSKLPWPVQLIFFPIIIPVKLYHRFKGKTVSPAEMDVFDLEIEKKDLEKSK